MMRFTSKRSMSGLLVVLALLLSATGCGDDGNDDGGAGEAGSTSGGKGGSGGSGGKGGSGGTGGKGGSGGAGGKGGSGGSGGAASVAMCKTQTDAVNLPDGCSTCACEENAQAFLKCDSACWALIACAAEKCDVPSSEAQACAGAMCKAEIDAASASGSVGFVSVVAGVLQGEECGDVCSASDQDAGT